MKDYKKRLNEYRAKQLDKFLATASREEIEDAQEELKSILKDAEHHQKINNAVLGIAVLFLICSVFYTAYLILNH